MTEREWQTQVVQCLKLHGWRVYHTYDSRRSQPGFPDLVASNIRLRATIHVELKTETGKTSPAQETWLSTIAASGYARVWRPSDWDEVQRIAAQGPGDYRTRREVVEALSFLEEEIAIQHDHVELSRRTGSSTGAVYTAEDVARGYLAALQALNLSRGPR